MSGGWFGRRQPATAHRSAAENHTDEKDLATNRESYVQALRQQQARSLRKVLIDRLRTASKVEINEKAIRANGGQAGA